MPKWWGGLLQFFGRGLDESDCDGVGNGAQYDGGDAAARILCVVTADYDQHGGLQSGIDRDLLAGAKGC